MSGICGVLKLGGGQVSLGPMLDLLERRGPDGTHEWINGPVVLGHTSLATTPEALVEVLPLTDRASGCTITADVRLDNREELFGELGLRGETRTIGDGELILRAYLQWGEECPTHLLGDFAFAIWDPRVARLFCARDHMGMRQLIYHHAPGKLFAFATEADALVAHPAVPKPINNGRIADFLDNLEGLDLTSTMFEEIVRLPPAHVLIVDAQVATSRDYWKLQLPPPLVLESDDAYSKAFLDVFTEAVRCRLRSNGVVGSMLSGGIDSNSVAAVAARLLAREGHAPLRTFSAIGPDAATCVETKAIVSASADPMFSCTMIDFTRLDSSDDALFQAVKTIAEPFDGQMTLIRAIYLAAHQQSVRIMLDGVGGDIALASGNRVAGLLRQGRVVKAMQEVRLEKRFWKTKATASADFMAAAWAAFAPDRVRSFRRKLSWWRLDWLALKGQSRIDARFARDSNLVDRRGRFRQFLGQKPRVGAAHRARSIVHPNLVVGRERFDRVASALAIEPRDPFMDIRVIRLCLAMPQEQMQDGGWPKIVLRRAMKDFVHQDVAWRRGKEHLGWRFTDSLFEQHSEWKATVCNAAPALRRFLAREPIEEAIRPELGASEFSSAIELFYLACWLERNCS